MDRPTRNGHSGHAVRLLATFAVLLGLLGMHGLASGHHAQAAAGQPAAASTHDAVDVQPAHHATTPPSTGQPPIENVVGPTGSSSCDDDCPSAVLALCLAVLASAAALLGVVVLLHRLRRASATPLDAAAAGPTSARMALPPPDPVRELCISRT